MKVRKLRRFILLTFLPLHLVAENVASAANELPAATTGAQVREVLCRNLTTGQSFRVAVTTPNWDCMALGLAVSSGDRVLVGTRGWVVAPGASSAESLWVTHILVEGGVIEDFVTDVGDLDGDGDIDIVFPDPLAWYENLGGTPPMFLEHVLGTGSDHADQLQVADIDLDGKLDIVTAVWAFENALTWFHNLGGDPVEFRERRIDGENGWGHWAIDAGDIDGDGDMDVVAVMQELPFITDVPEQIVWFENDSQVPASFTKHVLDEDDSKNSASDVALGDFDLDGDLDVVHVDGGDRNVRWYENQGGSPASFVTHLLDPDFNGFPGVADLDGDGDADIAVGSTSVFDNEIRLYENLRGAPPAFATHSIDFVAPFPSFVYPGGIADIDGDGRLDLVVGGNGALFPAVAWLENQGGSPPTFVQHGAPGEAPANGAAGADLDGDGDGDMTGVNTTGAWFENRFTFGGWVVNVAPEEISCRNLTTGQSFGVPFDGVSWDCVALGLAASPGDRVATFLRGIVD